SARRLALSVTYSEGCSLVRPRLRLRRLLGRTSGRANANAFSLSRSRSLRTAGAVTARLVAIFRKVVAVEVRHPVARCRQRFASDILASRRVRAHCVSATVGVIRAVVRGARTAFVVTRRGDRRAFGETDGAGGTGRGVAAAGRAD